LGLKNPLSDKIKDKDKSHVKITFQQEMLNEEKELVGRFISAGVKETEINECL